MQWNVFRMQLFASTLVPVFYLDGSNTRHVDGLNDTPIINMPSQCRVMLLKPCQLHYCCEAIHLDIGLQTCSTCRYVNNARCINMTTYWISSNSSPVIKKTVGVTSCSVVAPDCAAFSSSAASSLRTSACVRP